MVVERVRRLFGASGNLPTGGEEFSIPGFQTEMPPLPGVRLHQEAEGWRVVYPPAPFLVWRSVFQRDGDLGFQIPAEATPAGVFMPPDAGTRLPVPHKYEAYQYHTWGPPGWDIIRHEEETFYLPQTPLVGNVEALLIAERNKPEKGGIIIARVILKVGCSQCDSAIPQFVTPDVLAINHFLKKDHCPSCGSQELSFISRPPFPIRSAVFDHLFHGDCHQQADVTDLPLSHPLCDMTQYLKGGFLVHYLWQNRERYQTENG